VTPGRINAVDIPAEILLFVVTVTALRTFDRVFLDTSFTRPLLTTALVVHVVLFITRRLRGGLLLSFLTSLVALVLQVTATFFGETSRLGLPTGRTSDAFNEAVAEGWRLFNDVTAPAPVATGFLVGASLAIWAVAFLADWAAFRLRTPGEALLPSLAIIIFIGLFGLPDNRLRHATFYFAAAVAFLLAHRAASRVSTGNWLGGDTGRAYGVLVSIGAVVGLLALVVGVRAAPALPWADDAALFEWRDLNDGETGSRKVISPLVDIRGRMVDQQDIEMFTVRVDSETGSYWRLTSLDRYNGGVWTSEGDYRSADGDLPVSYRSDGESRLLTQEFTITGLSGLWLPTAYQAVSFEGISDVSVSYEPDAATLIIGSSSDPTDDSVRYTVQSAVPDLTAEFLEDLSADDIDASYLALPEGFSPMAREIAQDLSAGLERDYDKALALQRYFEDFTYDINVAPGHSEQVVEQFLENRVGYCEQFAGTYAAMARSVGLPSRVAVGFTKGIADPDDPSLLRVRGEHGHAWPEVFLNGAGWVAFEPTPGRGFAGASNYMPGVVEAQHGSPAGESNAGAQQFDTPTPGPNDPTLPTPVGQLPLEPEFPEAEFAAGDEPLADVETPSRVGTYLRRGSLGLLGVILLLAIAPALKFVRRRQAFAGADSPRDLINVTWNAVVEDLEPHGVNRSHGETNGEFADRAAELVPSGANEIRELGHAATLATYAPEAPSARDADTAADLSQTIRKRLDENVTISRRLGMQLDPRPLLPTRARTARVKQSTGSHRS